jgi:hypothetical protein
VRITGSKSSSKIARTCIAPNETQDQPPPARASVDCNGSVFIILCEVSVVRDVK